MPGPGQLSFDDVRTTYLVGSVALALILFDGGPANQVSKHPDRAGAVDGAGDGRCAGTALVAAPAAKYASI
jgi:cell volume regulation protein A